MNLAGLLKLAALVGLDLEALKRIVLAEGEAAGERFLKNFIRERMENAVPGILTNLATKAPLDGQKRTDKDGVEFSAEDYFLHESLYLLVKSVVKKGGPFIDGWRDAHVIKDLAAVNAQPGAETREALLARLIDAEIEQTF